MAAPPGFAPDRVQTRHVALIETDGTDSIATLNLPHKAYQSLFTPSGARISVDKNSLLAYFADERKVARSCLEMALHEDMRRDISYFYRDKIDEKKEWAGDCPPEHRMFDPD